MKQDHYIETATFDLSIKRVVGEYKSNRTLFELQDRLLDQLQNKGIPQLETLFDQFSGQSDEFITIDQLEVNLTATTVDDLEKNFPDILEKAVRESIAQLPLATQRKVSRQDSVRQTFFHFVKTGQLPWNASVNSIADLEEVMSRNINEISGLNTFFYNQGIRKRIITQFSDTSFKQIVRHNTNAPEVLLKFFNEIKKTLKKKHTILMELMKDWILVQSDSSGELLEEKMKIVLMRMQKNEFTTELDSKTWFEKNVLSNDIRPPLFDESILVVEKSQRTTESLMSENGTSKLNKQTNEEELEKGQSIFLPFTGLVLMAPFLKSMFEALNLLANNDFKTKADQEKAVHLLYYMCTGKTQPDEIATTFFKLVCDMKMHYPIRKNVVLLDKEKVEVNTCLQAAINHWKVLKSTSPEGLRDGFLQRSGKIEQKEDHWKLIVESKTIDILLKDIPWSFSIVKLPWMSKMIFVDWVS